MIDFIGTVAASGLFFGLGKDSEAAWKPKAKILIISFTWINDKGINGES